MDESAQPLTGAGIAQLRDQLLQLTKPPPVSRLVSEPCTEFHEGSSLRPFITAVKAVFHVGCSEPKRACCPIAKRLGLDSMRMLLDPGNRRSSCRSAAGRQLPVPVQFAAT
ncbi:hypothetical protein ACWD5F_04960 [Streptomyces sp. NPDC002499]